MIETLKTYESGSFDPYFNLAVEQHLLETVEGGCCLLYLWQNENTVVIGRNQNPWAECRVSLLEEEGGHLVRRLSGGGAVFHDHGNLNFTFLVQTSNYDLEKQQRVLLTACRQFGISAELSGRNDLTVGGRKFSGNAFYRSGNRSYHHGTLLVDVDGNKLSRYLTPGKAKLESKSVSSVRSRVVNLKELCPAITIDALKESLTNAFEQVYELKSHPLVLSEEDQKKIDELKAFYMSRAWCCGIRLPFTFRCEKRFPWGNIELQLLVESGIVRKARIYSDDMDSSFPPALEKVLEGCPFSSSVLSSRVQQAGIIHSEDICTLLQQQEI